MRVAVGGNDHLVVVLVGKDGGVKLNRQADTRLKEIFGLIDAMPMRQMEMKQKSE